MTHWRRKISDVSVKISEGELGNTKIKHARTHTHTDWKTKLNRLPIWVKDINLQIRDAQRTPNRINSRINTQTSHNQTVAREKWQITYRRTMSWMTIAFSTETIKVIREWNIFK